MSNRRIRALNSIMTAIIATAVVMLSLSACGEQSAAVVAEDLPEIRPNLPAVPSVPPPRHKIQYDDGTWSVYGLRKRLRQNINEEVRVKAFVVKVFTPEPCPEGRTCPPASMPHLWLGDDQDETSERKLLRLVGYAQSQQEMDTARENAEKGRDTSAEEAAAGLPPVIFDWQQGKQYVVKGRFTRSSGTGFAYSEGLLEYMEHTCLDCPPEEEE
jgi:hypothetical protein